MDRRRTRDSDASPGDSWGSCSTFRFPDGVRADPGSSSFGRTRRRDSPSTSACREHSGTRRSARVTSPGSSWKVQERLLAGADYGAEAADRTQLFGFEEDEVRLIDAALEGIERFSSVGIVDRFDESLAQAYDVLDLPGRPEVVYDNRTPARNIDQEITEEVLDHARRLRAAASSGWPDRASRK